eukprot:scaffold218524_cov37-Tisochrysis_lutea.AAC.3
MDCGIASELLHPTGAAASKGYLRYGAGIPGLVPSDPENVARHVTVAALGLAGAVGYMLPGDSASASGR